MLFMWGKAETANHLFFTLQMDRSDLENIHLPEGNQVGDAKKPNRGTRQ